MKPYAPIYEADYSPELSSLRLTQLTEDGLVHYATIGYFLQWFAAVEQGVDFLLMWAARLSDPETYEILNRGLLPRNKCERLRAICKSSKVKIGPNLDARLTQFAGRVCDVRNRVAHSFAVHGNKTEWIEFFNVGEVRSPLVRGQPRARFRIRSHELFEHGYWLKSFAIDLQRELLRPAPQLKTLEITAPTSGLPKAQNQDSQAKASHAKPDKLAQNQAAKRRAKKKD